MLPNKTLAASNDTLAGTKLMKDKLIITHGIHKFPLFIIDKSKKHRAFKNINLSSMSVYYCKKKSVWMDCNLLKSWFIDEFVPSIEKDLKQK